MATTTEVYGISETITGITIETRNISEQPLAEPIPDQQNHVTAEKCYSTRKNLTLTYRGTKLSLKQGTSNVITIDSVDWFVDSHEEAGSYNGLKRYTLTAHCFVKAS